MDEEIINECNFPNNKIFLNNSAKQFQSDTKKKPREVEDYQLKNTKKYPFKQLFIYSQSPEVFTYQHPNRAQRNQSKSKDWQVDISNREEKLVRCLKNLFEEIDLNNNSLLEWNEFTNYIIEKATVLNNIKSKSDEIKQYSKSAIRPVLQKKEQQNKEQHKEQNKAVYKFENLIQKVIYLPNIDRLAMFEEGSCEIIFVNPETGVINQKNLVVKPKPIPVEISKVTHSQKNNQEQDDVAITPDINYIDYKTTILDILYIPDKKYQVLLTATTDCFVRGWKQSSNGWVLAAQPENNEEVIEHHFNNEIYTLTWDSQNERLYCGQKDGVICIWNFKTDTEDEFKVDRTGGHTGVIMDMIAMPKLQFLASASLDSKIILWETINYTKKRTYQEHTRGIVSLAFNESLILLFSGGFDHDVITLDSEGVVKLTDIKKFNQIQTFMVETSDEKHQFLPQYFTYIPKPLKLAFVGRTLQMFEYDKNYNPKFVDDYVAICCKFIPSQLAFYTPAGNKIKIWSALTGDIKKIFSDMTKGEITVFELDRHQKRMIIGDSLGYVTLFNVFNGAKIKSLPRHHGSIINALHGMQRKGEEEPEEFFISAGSDNIIHMTKDNEFGENEIIRTLELKEVIISSLNFQSQGKMIIVGLNNGNTGFYESDTGKLNGTFCEPIKYEEITKVTLLKDISLFVITTTSLGNINFISMPPLLYKYTKVFKIENTDPLQGGQNLQITDCIYCEQNKQLFISDEKGFIKCFDISIIIEKLKEVQDAQYGMHAKSYSTLPKIPENLDMEPQFIKRAHNDSIKSISYIPSENLLTTTSFDKKVKIWNSQTGELIDGLVQNYSKKDPKPIAFKRSGTDEIYNLSLDKRIDKKFAEEKLYKQRYEQYQRQSLGLRFDASLTNLTGADGSNLDIKNALQNNQSLSQIQQQQPNEQQDIFSLFTYQKSPEEEFNPNYYKSKIDQKQIENFSSNPDWKLHINFKKYYEQFQSELQDLILKVKAEEQLQKQIKDKQSSNIASLAQFHAQQDTVKQFGINHKPIIEESKLKLENDTQFIGNQNFLNKTKKNKSSLPRLDQSKLSSETKSEKKKDHFNHLYRSELKGKLLYRSNQQISLSKSEAEAAYRLAAALTNYDQDDQKALKFLEIKIKKSPNKQQKYKNKSSIFNNY
ncbi:WD40-repeat-containing domain [Pseudocohnilembus persalinus]|uniref:WD40-repeat-containing domain n=1 Tax=Pseudocohnilembus persalinus TaxID=266149 RepID=A0A0V0R108_PSEPJ|nr:WD40-repeat-containing domain [Pseudocohnilembus persalinus]|eukprot:KRX07968.1 WD40-repeat-containing domain [Pseudocohnilembus persalinus]